MFVCAVQVGHLIGRELKIAESLAASIRDLSEQMFCEHSEFHLDAISKLQRAQGLECHSTTLGSFDSSALKGPDWHCVFADYGLWQRIRQWLVTLGKISRRQQSQRS